MNLPTAVDTRARIDAFVDTLESERDRAVVQVWRDHWWGEVVGDLDATMATMPDDPTYRTYGPVNDGPLIVLDSAAEARRMYEGMLEAGLLPGGPFDDERFTFAPWGMFVDTVATSVTLGGGLGGATDAPPDQLYLVRMPVSMIVPFDFDRNLMLGEIVYGGTLLSIEPVDRSVIPALLGFER